MALIGESATKRKDMARYLKLLPYSRVREKIIEAVRTRHTLVERVPIDSALGRVCAEEVVSPCDVPAISTSAMDGYAIRTADAAKADASHPILLRVKGTLYAGSRRPSSRLRGGDAYYVATGAPIPEGADAVVKVEETRQVGNGVSVSVSVPRGKNVALRGEDIRAGRAVVTKGHVANAADIALLVSAGKRSLAVFGMPKVGILSTGDELTLPGREEEGKKANNYSNLLAGYLTCAGAIPVPLGVAKDYSAEILGKVERNIEDLDALITIGGSSVGRKDYTPDALKGAADFVEVFHGIRLVPVRPAGLFTVEGKPVVLLPGHAVAASLAFFLVVRPIINLLSGLSFDSGIPVIRAYLTEALSNPHPIEALFLTKLTVDEGGYDATPLRWGSNLMSSLVTAHAYVRLGPQQSLEAGEEVAVTLLGAQEISRIPRRGTQ